MSLVKCEAKRDAQLVAEVRDGSMAALGELYDRYANSLFRTACRFAPSAAEAEEVVHDVFVGLGSSLSNYRERGEFERWIRRVTVRRAIDRRARGQRFLPWPGSERDPRHPADDPVERLALRKALAALPATLRDVFVLKEIEGYTHREIGRILGIRPGASAVRLTRARKKLRRSLR